MPSAVTLLVCCLLLSIVSVSVLSLLHEGDHVQAGVPCPQDKLSTLLQQYVGKVFTLLDRIHFSNPIFKRKYIMRPEVQRNVLLWQFIKMDINHDGVLDFSEITSMLSSLSEDCRYSFFEQCNSDVSAGITSSDWVNCLVVHVPKPKPDKCLPTPFVNVVDLPPGCIDPDTEKGYMDVGMCSNQVCPKNSEMNDCSEGGHCCCQSVKTLEVPLKCNGTFHETFVRVTECGCLSCNAKSTLS